AQRELAVVNALALAAGPGLPVTGDARGWHQVILTGFNTVDDACSTYMNDLWKADRQRNKVNNILVATGAAAAAIVGARTNPPGHTLTILAQAFGLGAAISNTVWESYLFSQNPAIIKSLVKKSSDAYRDALFQMAASNAGAAQLASPAAAYYHVREY